MGLKGGGNIIDFVAEMERTGIRPQDIKKAVQLILDWTGYKTVGDDRKTYTERPDEPEENKPLTFQLQLDPEHGYFKKRYITPETVKHFGLGYANKGIMKSRICIPIHDQNGNLVAYAGRALDEKLAEDEGKYKLPVAFHKSLVLFNFHRICDFNTLILVEGFFDCFKVHQAGFPNVCALMGTAMSEFHEKLILEHFNNIVLMLDNDPAGIKCTKDILNRFYDKIFIRTVKLDNVGKSQPHEVERVLKIQKTINYDVAPFAAEDD
jgi:DNA primase